MEGGGESFMRPPLSFCFLHHRSPLLAAFAAPSGLVATCLHSRSLHIFFFFFFLLPPPRQSHVLCVLTSAHRDSQHVRGGGRHRRHPRPRHCRTIRGVTDLGWGQDFEFHQSAGYECMETVPEPCWDDRAREA